MKRLFNKYDVEPDRRSVLAAGVIMASSLSLRFGYAETAAGTPLREAAGVLDVRQFGARGDGRHDDLPAVREALRHLPSYSREAPYSIDVVFFPVGTYLLYDTIERRDETGRFLPNLVLIGEDRDHTILRLADGLAGFADPRRPRAAIRTASGAVFINDPNDGGRDYLGTGGGNEAFGNVVESLTIDTGRNNPGAIGIDYLANNMGAVRNVQIRSGDAGTTGLAITRRWPGPALIEDVTIDGFETGIDITNSNYSMTLSNVRIGGSTGFGLRNSSNLVCFEQLTINASRGAAIANLTADSMVVGIGGAFSSEAGAPLLNEGFANLASCTVRSGTGAKSEMVDGVYTGRKRLSDVGWRLPVPSVPKEPRFARSDWYVANPGSSSSGTSRSLAEILQTAAASGCRGVLLGAAHYPTIGPIDVPDEIEVIDGLFSNVLVGGPSSKDAGQEPALFRTRAGRHTALHLKRLIASWAGRPAYVVEHAATTPLVLADIVGFGGIGLVFRPRGGGTIFGCNTSAGSATLNGPNGAWFRQFNSEGPAVRLRNIGAPVWLLGAKTEQTNTLVLATDGAVTEVIGGFVFRVFGTHTDTPAFENIESTLRLAYVEECTRPAAVYDTPVRTVTDGAATLVQEHALPRRGRCGRAVPFAVWGEREPDATVRPPPTTP